MSRDTYAPEWPNVRAAEPAGSGPFLSRCFVRSTPATPASITRENQCHVCRDRFVQQRAVLLNTHLRSRCVQPMSQSSAWFRYKTNRLCLVDYTTITTQHIPWAIVSSFSLRHKNGIVKKLPRESGGEGRRTIRRISRHRLFTTLARRAAENEKKGERDGENKKQTSETKYYYAAVERSPTARPRGFPLDRGEGTTVAARRSGQRPWRIFHVNVRCGDPSTKPVRNPRDRRRSVDRIRVVGPNLFPLLARPPPPPTLTRPTPPQFRRVGTARATRKNATLSRANEKTRPRGRRWRRRWRRKRRRRRNNWRKRFADSVDDYGFFFFRLFSYRIFRGFQTGFLDAIDVDTFFVHSDLYV